MKKPMERHRYIGFLLHSFDSKVTKSELWEELKKQCKHQYSCSYQEFGFRLIRFNGKAGILKCPHTQKNQSIKLLQSLRKVAEKKVELRTMGTSGTIRSLIQKHMDSYWNNSI